MRISQNITIKGAVFAFVAVMFFASVSYAAGGGKEFVPPSHPHIRYTGRFDMQSPRAVRFDWPGNAIELRFGGTSCAIRIRGDGGRYNVFVNDSLFVARFDTLYTTHKLVANLPDTVHTLKIVKRFEGIKGHINTISGFYLDKGKTLHPLGDPPPRKVEFIGGSNLLGFGAEANTVYCENPFIHSNTYLSFGYAAARELDAECRIVAMSGKGLSRNWQSPFVSSPRTFGHYYDRTLRNDSLLRWDFDSWTPDVVVVNFGVNDFSTRPHTPEALFKATYRNFIQEVSARYPSAHVVCMTSSREPLKAFVKEIVKEFQRDGNPQIHFYSFAQLPQHLCGCDWHPNKKAHAKIGKELADVIRPLLPKY